MATARCIFAAEIHIDSKHPCGMHSHACTELIYYFQGTGQLIQNGRKFSYRPGMIAVYQPTMEHADTPSGHSVQLCVGVSGCGAEKLADGMWQADESICSCAERILQEIRNPLERDSLERLDMLSGWLALELKRISQRISVADILPEPVSAAKQIFDSDFSRDIDLQELAGSLYINPDYFRHIFKKSLGESPLNYLIRKRIEYACELLNFTELSVGEIANRVGLDNVYYFSRIFRKRQGVSPSLYRQNIRKK